MFCSQPHSTVKWNPHMEDFLSENTKPIRDVAKDQQKTKQGAGVIQSLSMCLGRHWPELLTQLTSTFTKSAQRQPQPALTPKKGSHTPGTRRNVRSRKPDKLLYNPVLISLHNPNQLPPKTTSFLPSQKKKNFQMLISTPAEIPA